MNYSSADIANILGATVSGHLVPYILDTYSFDSRKIVFPKATLFFCIETKSNDGHRYIDKAYAAGVRNFVVSKTIDPLEDANFFKVENAIAALQKLASHHRSEYNPEVLAITGSYGKTIVKEWIYQMLFDKYDIARSPQSYNSQIGVPLSLLRIKETSQMAIIEVGISQEKEMARLEKIIQPSIGILTNIGAAHDEGFQSRELKIQEKLRLFENCEYLILEKNSNLDKYLSQLTAKKWIWTIDNKKQVTDGTLVDFKINETNYQILLPFRDASSIQNAMHAVCFLLLKEVSIEEIARRITSLPSVSMRLEMNQGINNSILINDAYIADSSSLQMALDFQELNRGGKKKVLVLSDFAIHESVLKSQYDEILALIHENDIAQLFTIGKEIQEYISFKNHTHFSSVDDAIRHFTAYPLSDVCVLLKGSRISKLDKLAHFLSNQIHDTILEIDLNAVATNFSTYRSHLERSTKMIGVVKAGAYGSGIEIAKTLVFHQIDYLAVAFPGEGIELRQAGIKTPIIILNPQKSSISDLERYKLEPEIYSLDQLSHLSTYAKDEISIHINLNTGMNRLGIELSEITSLVDIIRGNKKLKVTSVFSHLSSSEDQNDDDYTHRQAQLFKTAADQLSQLLGIKPIYHLLNSAGIPRFLQYHFDAVRLGLGLYGIDTGNTLRHLEKAHSLRTRIIQIKTHEKGTDIGYNRKGTLHKKTRIATIPLGYADGIPYILGENGYAFIVNGQKAPIVGKICMDLIMLDVTDLEAVVGDEVVIFDNNYSIENLAKQANTIPYEILSGISSRVKRNYIQY